MAFIKKADIILTHQEDILIFPECEHPDKLIFNGDTEQALDTTLKQRVHFNLNK